jgi:low affinity Fe/Cu permease
MPKLNVEKLAKILLIIFACSTAISALSIYYTHQLPTHENRTTTLCTYQHTGAYQYVAKLKPNIIYNKTTLSPGEGTLYTAIVEYVNLTFTYTFKSNPNPKNIQVDHQTTIQVESPERWMRTLTDIEAQEILQLNGNLNFSLQINCTKVKQFVEAIDKEIYGTTRSTAYNINIKPEIHLTANITAQKIDETFTPELTVAFKTEAEKGSYIAIENLNQTKQDAITKTEQITLPQTQNQKAASYIATATTAAALTISAFLYMRYKPPTPPTKTSEKIIKKLTAPYNELIAKTTQKPPETKITIETESLEDLAKIAEILARPILHTTETEEHTFYIIDNNTKYQYTTKA